MNNTTAERILNFNRSLRPDWKLPSHVELLYPYDNEATWQVMEQFYHKYYNDDRARVAIFGINPGRFGAGVTGVPFTDPKKLESECGIANPFAKKPELSSEYVYLLINQWGGAAEFYQHFYITSLCPLGFTKDGKNYNYYDDKKLEKAAEPHIIGNIQSLLELGISSRIAYSLGKGKNMQYFERLNQKHRFFDQVVALPHPRWVMQYRRKRLQEFLDLSLERLHKAPPLLS
jgi:uracil-DNA glycosylase